MYEFIFYSIVAISAIIIVMLAYGTWILVSPGTPVSQHDRSGAQHAFRDKDD